MSSRTSYTLAVLLLLLAAGLRLWNLTTLPPGLHQEEINDIRIAETARQGRVEVFYNLGREGREGLYHAILAAVTGLTGDGLLGYRILSVWVNLLALALVYTVTARLFGPLAAVVALGLLSVNLWAILLGRSIARETLLPLIVAAVLLALIRIFLRTPSDLPPLDAFSVLGIVLGSSLYVHPAGFAIILLAVVFIAFLVLSRQPLPLRTVSYTSFSILLMIIIATPYVISSIRLPQLAGAGRLLGEYSPVQQPLLQAILNGLGGILFLGDQDVLHNVPARPLIDLVSALFILIGAVTCIRYLRRPRFALPILGVLALSPLAFISINSPNFLAITGLMPTLAILFGLGVSVFYQGVGARMRLAALVGLGVLLLFNLLWTVNDLFREWPQLPTVQTSYHSRLGHLAHHLDLTAASYNTVLCIPSLPASAPQPTLSNLQLLELMMHREETRIRYVACNSALVFANGGEQQQIVLVEPDALDHMHPYLREWLRDAQVRDEPLLPPEAILEVNVEGRLADTVGRFQTTTLTRYAPEAPGGEALAQMPVHFGGNLTFLGYDFEGSATSYRPGETVTVITYWRVDGSMPPDVRLFTHILYDPVVITAQTDTLSLIPASLEERDVFIQVTHIPLPPSTPAGTYTISVGAYEVSDADRLNVLVNGQPRGRRLFLYDISVATP